jgi:hypothetical protein
LKNLLLGDKFLHGCIETLYINPRDKATFLKEPMMMMMQKNMGYDIQG